MQVKVFRAAGMRDALDQVKADLGPNAVILSTQHITDRIHGNMVEVRASPGHDSSSLSNTGLQFFQKTSPGKAFWPSDTHPTTQSAPQAPPPAPRTLENPALQTRAPLPQNPAPEHAVVTRELYVKDLTQNQPTPVDLTSDQQKLVEARDQRALAQLRRALAEQTSFDSEQEPQDRWQPLTDITRWLRDADVSSSVQSDLSGHIKNHLQHIPRPSQDQVEGALIHELVKRIQLSPSFAPGQHRTIAFIGPTGVGKTTTLAKRAAHLTLELNLQVGIITIDTYRIGAIEQLRKYATMLRLPFEIVIDVLSLQQAMSRLRHCDVILIDTIGRSPRDPQPLEQISDLLGQIPNLTYELCISATTSHRDMMGIISNYKTFSPDALIFTKLDETFAAGPMLSAHLEALIPLSFFTTGQSVPDDIENASVERILSMIIPPS